MPRLGPIVVLATCVLLWAASTAVAATGDRKHLIEFGWDEPDTSFLKRHLAQMEQTPFHGCVYHATFLAPNGGPESFSSHVWGRRAFGEAELARARDDLSELHPRRFTDNFLRFNVTPGDIDWFDDFAPVLANARLAASLARTGKSKGILLDVEQYAGPVFDYSKQRDAGHHSCLDYAAQARLRGQALMEAFQSDFEGVIVFLTYGYALAWREAGRSPAGLCGSDYGLLAPFLDGLLDTIRPPARLIDGHEASYGFRTRASFDRELAVSQTDVLAIVGDVGKYRSFMSHSFGVFMDYQWRTRGWSTTRPNTNYFAPWAFEATVRTALRATDRYVWIYTEKPSWWVDVGVSSRVPRVYEQALRRAVTVQ